MSYQAQEQAYRNSYQNIVSHTLTSLFVAAMLTLLFYNAIEMRVLPGIMRFLAIGAGLVMVFQLGYSMISCARALLHKNYLNAVLWIIFIFLQFIIVKLATYVILVCFGLPELYTDSVSVD